MSISMKEERLLAALLSCSILILILILILFYENQILY